MANWARRKRLAGGVVPTLTYVEGDLLTSPAQTLVNTVNLVGVMGKGIALRFKQVYPEMFREYQEACRTGAIAVGRPWIYRTPRKWIMNFPTKRHWRQRSRIEDIEAGLDTFVRTYASEGIHSVAFPALGCGNGELPWDEVRPLMERYLKALPIDVFIYPPLPKTVTPEHRVPNELREWLRSEPAALPVAEVWDDFVEAARARFSVDVTEIGEFVPGEPARALEIRTESVIYQVAELDLEVAWDLLRTRGYLSREYAENLFREAVEIVWKLMLDQPYIEEVVTYTAVSKKRQPTLQLRVPPATVATTPACVLSSVSDV